MHTSAPTHPYKHHRFPAEIISHGVWLYFPFCLSYRDVEELLFWPVGFLVTYETIRKWCLKFGQAYANQLRHRRPGLATNGTWTRCFSRSTGHGHYLWRAVDQDGHIPGMLGQSPSPWNRFGRHGGDLGGAQESLTDSPMEERKEARGQIANENRLTSGNCRKRFRAANACMFNPYRMAPVIQDYVRGDGMRHFVTHFIEGTKYSQV